jgi:hypothetical protein
MLVQSIGLGQHTDKPGCYRQLLQHTINACPVLSVHAKASERSGEACPVFRRPQQRDLTPCLSLPSTSRLWRPTLAKIEDAESRPSGTRTLDTLIKSQVLYQTELTAHKSMKLGAAYFSIDRRVEM